VWAVAALFLLVVSAAACGGEGRAEDGSPDPGTTPTPRPEEAVPVEVTTLESGLIESVLRFSATLEAERQVQVFAEAPRRVVDLLVEEGDSVKSGALLVRLQDEEQRSNVARVESQLNRARRELDRQRSLFSQKLISEQTFTDAGYEVEQLELALADARRELAYTEVRAPITGTVTERLVNLGDHVTINQALFGIVDFDSIVARIYVPEKNLPALRTGQLARLRSEAAGGLEFSGSVERISPVVDPGTGTVKVTVATPRQTGLRPGMYVEVQLVTAVHENAVRLPKRALVYDSDQIFCFRLSEERRVERIEVRPQLQDSEFVEPGPELSAGDQVVVAGQAGLKDNALVRLPGDPEPTPEDAEKDE
jgi:membrane fusion protein (multidrug efflux system)